MKKKSDKCFFGVELRNNGAFWHTDVSAGFTVSLWISKPLAEPKPGWSAKLVGTSPALTMALVVHGRSAREALRILERRSLNQVRALVGVFARLSNKPVLDVRKNFHKSRKK